MDAPDDENDVKLHRASADLLSDISSRIDELLTATSMAEEPLDQPIWVPDSQIEKLNSLVSTFLGDSCCCADWSTFSSIVSKNGPNYLILNWPSLSIHCYKPSYCI